jgi:SAM-dependent methyltransferase
MALRTATVAGWLGSAVAVGAAVLLWRFVFFLAPFAWTGEPARLAGALGIGPGMRVADIGAGRGDLAVAMAGIVGADGLVFATELSAARREDIARRASVSDAGNVRIVNAQADETGLPPAGCDAVYLRMVFHHVADRAAFAAAAVRAVRPGGRIAIIDFAPGTLWFHRAGHGVRPEDVETAFALAGWRVRERVDDWGGGMYLLVFEAAPS